MTYQDDGVDYVAAGGFIGRSRAGHSLDPIEHITTVCTVPEAARAYEHLAQGPAICADRGHDYSVRVAGTSNMYLCFRCEEPGWEVPFE